MSASDTICNSPNPPLTNIVLFGFSLSRLNVCRMRLGRGFHILIKGVPFTSPTDVGSHIHPFGTYIPTPVLLLNRCWISHFVYNPHKRKDKMALERCRCSKLPNNLTVLKAFLESPDGKKGEIFSQPFYQTVYVHKKVAKPTEPGVIQ